MIRPGQALALCVLALLCIGVVMVNSADMSVTGVAGSAGPSVTAGPSLDAAPEMAPVTRAESVTLRSILASRTTVYLGLAVLALGVGYFFPVRAVSWRLSRPLDPPRGLRGINGRGTLVKLAAVSVLLVGVTLLAYAPVIGKEVNGAYRWLRLPVPGLGDALSVQPSEIVKWSLVAVVAWYGATRAAFMHRFWTGLVPALVAVGAVSAVVVLEDLGTGVLIAAASCVVLVAAGARVWQFLMLLPFAGAGLAAAIISNPYRIERIRS
ncbi:MAG TPA: FtsW/RodA/SpoVE family cell cycle protein, partial [Phycisphaerales bacterium]|nr:FtsW/RodA/SpoVE family cell cycle protein [Phycisphaerales bacterium]